MNKRFIIFLSLWVLAGSLLAETTADLQAQIDLFRAGRRAWNPVVMESARAGFARLARQRPRAYDPLYWQSASEFYLLLCYGLDDSSGYDPAKAEALLDPAEKTMKAAIAIRPEEAECHAMLSSVYGFRIVMHPFSAVWNGPKVLSLQSDALKNEPNNPRALYIMGAGYFRAPGILRNVDKAQELLERAEAMFEREPVEGSPEQPQWGRAECQGLLGDLMIERNDRAAARRHYQAALRINPNYRPAKRGLEEMSNGNKK